MLSLGLSAVFEMANQTAGRALYKSRSFPSPAGW